MKVITKEEMFVWLEELFNVGAGTLTLDSERESIEAWDSLGVVMLMADLDEHFDLTISNDELENLTSINSIYEFLRSKGAIKTT